MLVEPKERQWYVKSIGVLCKQLINLDEARYFFNVEPSTLRAVPSLNLIM